MKEKDAAEKGTASYERAKRMLNGLYGRFGLNPEMSETVLEWDDEESDLRWRTTVTDEDDIDAYLPVSIFTTAYARQKLIRSIESIGWDQLIHADTDSMIYYAPEQNDLDRSGVLGSWGSERTPRVVFEGGVKRYVKVLAEEVSELQHIEMACAGVPQKTTLQGVPIGMWVEILDDPEIITREVVLGKEDYQIKSPWLRQLYLEHSMDPDNVDTFKLIPVVCHGGVLLEKRQHRLSDNAMLSFRWRGRR